MTESDHMSPAPAVHCAGCQFAWNSPAMAEGLRLLGSCPKCSGELVFAAEAPVVPEPAPPEERFTPQRETAPHLVLGIPRR